MTQYLKSNRANGAPKCYRCSFWFPHDEFEQSGRCAKLNQMTNIHNICDDYENAIDMWGN